VVATAPAAAAAADTLAATIAMVEAILTVTLGMSDKFRCFFLFPLLVAIATFHDRLLTMLLQWI
jgi:hypothetical protein